jgi:hypothetical protein
MSEYQYYEFQAVDRPLTPREMAELRSRSTRATITPTRFQNVYHWGDLKGRPLDWMERYFDAFVYVANWGTNQLMVRLPRRLLDPRAAGPYEVDDTLDIQLKGDAVILEFVSRDEEGMGWIEDEEAESWMPALLPLRAELAGGDTRALYLGWLAAVEAVLPDDEEGEFDDEDAELDDDTIEPPVPPGLGQLSAPLATLARFLRISDDLLAVAAAGSVDLPAPPTPDELQHWIVTLPATEKDALLLQIASDPAHVRAELLRRFHPVGEPHAESQAGGRTVGELRAAAEARRAERERLEAERRAAEQARREREAALAREKHLDSLVGREEELWRQVDALIETKQPKQYDRAVALLTDLHDLSARQDRDAAYMERLDVLRERYMKRPALLARLNGAELNA